jgi:hypothetical protein
MAVFTMVRQSFFGFLMGQTMKTFFTGLAAKALGQLFSGQGADWIRLVVENLVFEKLTQEDPTEAILVLFQLDLG